MTPSPVDRSAGGLGRLKGTPLIFASLVLGVIVGGLLPEADHPFFFHLFQFLSKSFITLIKGIIVPILLATIITGIAQTGDLKAVGRMGWKALLYFEIVTTIALFLGLLIANTLKPGEGMPLARDMHTELAPQKSGWEIALHALPSNLVKHATEGDILPIVVFAALFGIALIRVGKKGAPVLHFFEGVAQVMFKYTEMIMKLTPLGVFGAMAYNVSHMASGTTPDGPKGWPAVFGLLKHYSVLVGSLYLALALMLVLVFIPVMLAFRIPIRGFFQHIREPATIAYSTASSEAALPRLLEQMERFGVPRATLVIIAGTCATFGLPGEAGVAMILAVDEIMDMARSALNLTGNGLAACVVARWEGVFREVAPPALEPVTDDVAA